MTEKTRKRILNIMLIVAGSGALLSSIAMVIMMIQYQPVRLHPWTVLDYKDGSYGFTNGHGEMLVFKYHSLESAKKECEYYRNHPLEIEKPYTPHPKVEEVKPTKPKDVEILRIKHLRMRYHNAC